MKYIDKIIRLILFLLLISSCSEDDMFTNGEIQGTLVVSDVNVDISVTDGTLLTKGSSFVAPDMDELTYTLHNIDNGKQLVRKGLPDKMVLEEGHYELSAEYGSLEMGTEPYLYGSTEFDIVSGETTFVQDFKVSLNCAIIKVNISEDLLSHYGSGYELTLSDGNKRIDINNSEDIFIAVEKNYEINFSGVNLIGETSGFSYELKDLDNKTRYIINLNPDLPSFTLPTQNDVNIWSRRIYITPLTAENIISHKEDMTNKILSNIKYEVSADGILWREAVVENDYFVIKELEPNTSYTLRARFGGVVSVNTQQFTTCGEPQLENSEMENWTSNKLHGGNGSWDKDLYCDYCTGWNTRNEKTTLGAEGANSGGIFGTLKGNGYGVYWRWYSGTLYTTDAIRGNAAEISTLAFYNDGVSGSWKRESVFNYTRDNGTAYAGYLFTGTFDKNSDTYDLGISHSVRPSSISFDYKYAPIEGDQCIAYAKVYDENKEIIAETKVFNSSIQETYVTCTLDFEYNDLFKKASYISVFFQSGTILDISKMNHVHGGYNVSPFNEDRIVGSVLKIDNIVLNYN